MGLFRKKNNEPNQIDVLRAEIVDLKQRLDASDQQKAKLLSMVGTVDQTNSLLNQRLESLDVAGAQLNRRIGDVDARVGNATQRIGASMHSSPASANSLIPSPTTTNESMPRKQP